MFTKAIVRPPAPNFSSGLTTSAFGSPVYDLALRQHEAYCAALEQCGLVLSRLQADPNYPDSTFVEDAAVLNEKYAVITRPGAASRRGEVANISAALENFFPASAIKAIEAPGTLDGGDVCEAGDRFFIGLSERTNEAGARQLADLLATHGYASSFVDIRGVMKSVTGAVATGSGLRILHLKSGLAYLGDNRLVITDELAEREEFSGYDLVHVEAGEEYAANCVRVNDFVLVAAGFPLLESTLRELGYQTIALEMSEFRKMEGGLSCLSLRF
jgi:dimethylargininase